MGRKNRRKKSAYTRKMKTGAKRLVTMKILKCQNNRVVWGHIVVTFGSQSLASIRGRASRKDAVRYLS